MKYLVPKNDFTNRSETSFIATYFNAHDPQRTAFFLKDGYV